MWIAGEVIAAQKLLTQMGAASADSLLVCRRDDQAVGQALRKYARYAIEDTENLSGDYQPQAVARTDRLLSRVPSANAATFRSAVTITGSSSPKVGGWSNRPRDLRLGDAVWPDLHHRAGKLRRLIPADGL